MDFFQGAETTLNRKFKKRKQRYFFCGEILGQRPQIHYELLILS